MTAPADIPALDIDAIRKRAEKAAPGPWSVVKDNEVYLYVKFAIGTDSTLPTAADASFIAHAREDVPALVAEVERLRILVTDTVEQIDSMGYAECADCHADHAAGEGHREDCIWTPLVAEAKRINGEKI